MLFFSASAIAFVVVWAAIVSTVLAIKATKAKRAQTELRQKAEQAQEVAVQAQKEAETLAQHKSVLVKQKEEDLYFNHIKLADQELKENRIVQALDYLNKCPEDLRHWEWHYLRRKSLSKETPSIEFDANVLSFDISSNGSILAAFCSDGNLVTIDLISGKRHSYSVRQKPAQLEDELSYWDLTWVAFCPDGEHTAVIGDDNTIILFSIVCPCPYVRTYRTASHPGRNLQ